MNLRLPKDEVVRRVDHALDYMDLQAFRERPPHELSGGEKKRVTIADILAMESEIILFDEPAASLDPAGEDRLKPCSPACPMRGGRSSSRRTTWISPSAGQRARLWFAGGRVIADGVPETVFRDTETLHRAHLKPPALLGVFDLLRSRDWSEKA